MGTEVLVGLAASAIAGGLQYENTRRTTNRQDAQAAQGIQRQGVKQRQADARVDSEVQKLAASTADDERRQRLGDYMQTIQRSKAGMTEGLAPPVGGDAFKADAAKAMDGIQSVMGDRAGLMARIDAPGMQRQGEAFGFGNLATDIQKISRESKGDDFINELRMRAIRRNPWLDIASSAVGAAGGAYASRAGTAAGAGASYAPVQYGGRAVYGNGGGGIRG